LSIGKSGSFRVRCPLPVPLWEIPFPNIRKPLNPKRSHEHTIDTAAIADIAFLCCRNGRKTGLVQNWPYQTVPQKIRSIQTVRTKKRRALDRSGTDYPAKRRRPLRSVEDRPYGDRSREQIPPGYALFITLSITSKTILMTSYKSNTPSNETPDLLTLLKALGHEPVSTGGDEFHYASVLGN